MSNRPRFAIAHFADSSSAAALRAALSARGVCQDATLCDPDPSDPAGQCLRVPLPSDDERALVGLLLESDATRVDIHDGDSNIKGNGSTGHPGAG